MPLTRITKKSTVAGSLSGDKLAEGAVTAESFSSDLVFPKITSVVVTDSSWTTLDDTAVGTTGGYAVITGSDFVAGCSVVIGTTNATSVTRISSTTLRVEAPALSAGSYDLYVVNPDGGIAVLINGLAVSPFPVWSTSSSLPDSPSGEAISITLSASDAVDYALAPGSSLPEGLTLSAGGVLSGTVTVAQSTVYNFTVRATDAQQQSTDRAFSIYFVVISLTYTITDSTWATVPSVTAVSTLGGDYIEVTGTGIQDGVTATIGGVAVTSLTFVNSTTVRIQLPARSAGVQTLFLFNPDSQIFNALVTYAAPPSWTTAASLTNAVKDVAFTRTLAATGATSYMVQAGSTLPAGTSLASDGTLSGTITGAATETYTFTVMALGQSYAVRTFTLLAEGTIANGQQAYTTAGTYTWTCPANVYKVSAVCVGGGGGGYGGPTANTNGSGGGGGGLGWKNNITVVPGQTYTVTVGANGPLQTTVSGTAKGGDSWFISAATVAGLGGGSGSASSIGSGRGTGGTYVGDGGGNGGNAGTGNTTQRNGGSGGGAGGYAGTGGTGGSANTTTTGVQGGAGSGGAGGGGGCPRPLANSGQSDRGGGGGGGVGLLGQGASGAATGNFLTPVGGFGGSGGYDSLFPVSGFEGGIYGGGGAGGGGTNGNSGATQGGVGAVRIIWGTGRAFPATNTGNL